MQTYVCKCGKTFEKSTKAETTGYELHDYSPQHECYGCPYIVIDRSWQTNEIVKRECRATPKITYLSKCHIGTGKGDFTACKVYSLDLTFVKRVMNYVNSLDGAETGDHLNRIPGEWRAADFGMCYSSDNCFGLAIFNLYFKNNKAGTAARRLVKERFFSESGVRKDMTEEKERETVLMRIQIAKENARNKMNAKDDQMFVNTDRIMDEGWRYAPNEHAAELIHGIVNHPKRKALEQKIDEPTEDDIALFEQYEEMFGRYCRFDKVYGADHKYTKQHYNDAMAIYDKIVSLGLEDSYKEYCEHKNSSAHLGADKIEEDKMARKLQFDAAITKDMKSAALDSFIDNIKMIDVKEIIPSEKNFYEMSAIELLADDIEREGLKHNLVVVKDHSTGAYEVKSGHRRLAAVELLIREKRIKSTKIPCIVDGEKTEAENELDLIMLNATQRKYSDAELLSEYEHLSQILKKLKNEGKGLNGHMRDNIAKILNVSNGQVGKLDNIKHNAVSEVEKAVKSGEMSISTANEVAKLAPEKQKEVVEKKPDISSAEVKKLQDKKPSAPPKPAETQNKHFDPDTENDDLDDNSSDDFEKENTEITPENKGALTLSLTLSENEAKTLLRFFYGFGDDYGAVSASDKDDLRQIKSKLEALCKKN